MHTLADKVTAADSSSLVELFRKVEVHRLADCYLILHSDIFPVESLEAREGLVTVASRNVVLT